MIYRERESVVPGVALWQRAVDPLPMTARILPDGCMDLIWDGTELFVAGPDTRARWHTSGPNSSYVGLRFSRGIGPGLLGPPATEVRDSSPRLEEVWPGAEARALAEQVAAEPAVGLERWLVERAGRWEPPRLGPAVFDSAARGVSVAMMADWFGLGVRQLRRRCLPLFGYGPQHLTRVLRLGRAVTAASTGMPLAQAAAASGFADQAHLSRDVRDLVGTTPTRLVDELAG